MGWLLGLPWRDATQAAETCPRSIRGGDHSPLLQEFYQEPRASTASKMSAAHCPQQFWSGLESPESMEAQDAPLAHSRGWRGPLEPAGLGLTSSSWPWSRPIHLWTCSGCSCPQSGKQRDCLDCAIREGALTCLGSFLPGPGSSSILSFTLPILLHCPQKSPQMGSRIILVVFSPPTPILLEAPRRPERK